MRIWSWGLRYRALLLCFVVVFLVNCLLTLFRKINSSDYPISKALLNSTSATCGCCSPSQFCRSNLYFRLDFSAGLISSARIIKGETIYTRRVAISHWILPWGWPDYFRRHAKTTYSKRDDVRLLFLLYGTKGSKYLNCFHRCTPVR